MIQMQGLFGPSWEQVTVYVRQNWLLYKNNPKYDNPMERSGRGNRLVEVTRGEASSSYIYNGLGDRVQSAENGVTTTYHLDLAAGLTQVLDDGQHTYLYGNGRIGYSSDDMYYFLGDALGSVRAVVQGDADAPVTLTRDYTPYGEVLAQTGEDSSGYGFTGEWADGYTGLLNLRARQYSPVLGRFISKDTWQGDYQTPMSYNAWLYGYANPVIFVDPSGRISCRDSDTPDCVLAVSKLKVRAETIKGLVLYKGGNPDRTLLPVEALAQLADDAFDIFDHDRRGMMWGMTNVLVGIDPNDYRYVSLQPVNDLLRAIGLENEKSWVHYHKYWVGENWLPYMQDPSNEKRTSSDIGDWNSDYFDGTANQAFHFWFYVASRYFDGDLIGDLLAKVGNVVHDPYFLEGLCGPDLQKLNNVKIFSAWAKLATGTSRQDYNLSLKGIQFGTYIRNPRLLSADPGEWIRRNLKGKYYR